MWTLLSTPLVSHNCQRYYSYNYPAASHILLYNITDNAVGIDLRNAARIRGYGDYFRAIHSYLSAKLSDHYTLKSCTNSSLQFTYHGVEVDLLLSPYFRNYGEYCSFLETIDRTQLSL